MTNKETLAYLAGVIDSDGYIGIRRSTYAMRVRKDATQPVYCERICVKQVESQAVTLLKEMFGGNLYLEKPGAPTRRAMYAWGIQHKKAAYALNELLPYLRIKKAQAENAINLRKILVTPRKHLKYIFSTADDTVFVDDFAIKVGVSPATVYQAARTGTVPAFKKNGRLRIPVSFIPVYKQRLINGNRSRRADSVSENLEKCFLLGKLLNKVGV